MKSRFFAPVFVSLLALASISLTGCFDLQLGKSTPGEEGRAEFSQHTDQDCFFGCALRPLTDGESMLIFINGDALPPDLGVAADPAHLDVSLERSLDCCVETANSSSCMGPADPAACKDTLTVSYTANVTARAAGTTALVLVRSDGSIFDEVTIEIEPSATR
jgi:hypothetical protein